MILFLDFDGVLHPGDVVMKGDQPTLIGEGCLFMWAPLLELALQPYPSIEIILSTSWAGNGLMGFDYSRNALPTALQSRVIGTTVPKFIRPRGDSSDIDVIPFSRLSRFHQIYNCVKTARYRKWLAIDDNADGWPTSQRKHLVRTQSRTGLSAPSAMLDLTTKLALMR